MVVMNELLLKAIVEFINRSEGRLIGGEFPPFVAGVATDTREIKRGDIFVALRGEHFDGHDFISEAIAKGASALFVEDRRVKAIEEDWFVGKIKIPVMSVRESLYALGELAKIYRGFFKTRVTALTGSTGKTTTREIVAAILRELGETLSPKANFNNLIGVPLTLFNLNVAHKFAVIEMGMNMGGEIQRLTEIVQPEAGLITNVMPVHLEGLGTIENIARAKGELFETIPKSAVPVVNLDDPRIATMKALRRFRKKVTFGRGKSADVRLVSYRLTPDLRQAVKLSIRGETISAKMRLLGRHNARNAAAAVALALAAGANLDAMKKGLESVAPFAHRLEIKRAGGITLLDDCYNSNPEAVKESLSVLCSLAPPEKRIAVLGEMRELGEESRRLHFEIGRFAAKSKLAALFCFGDREANEMFAGAERVGGGIVLGLGGDVERAVEFIRGNQSSGAVVLIKGSRALKLERIVGRLEE
ncbi:MAG: UDP-N-acetylmuramoyl-tripeptide--D-alanyl-D-alanine ligase [Myxococcota bacterium]